MTKWASVGCLLLVTNSATCLGQGKPPTKEPKVSVALSCSVEAYDPSAASQAVLKCVVRNGTPEAIQVPAQYDGNRLRLYSTRGLVLHRTKEAGLDRLEGKIAGLKRKINAADDPDVIVPLARDLADAM